MKRKFCLLLSLCLLLPTVALGACEENATESSKSTSSVLENSSVDSSTATSPYTIKSATDTMVAIEIHEASGENLLSVMEALQENNQLQYTIKNGMLSSINGKENPADFSSCWMLYTTDVEMSNTAWGTIEYDGKTIASAVLGAESLIVEEGELYVWSYVTF